MPDQPLRPIVGPGPAPVQGPLMPDQPLRPIASPQPAPAVPQCYGDVCITCSDEAVQVRVMELLPGELALVDTGQSVEEVSIALVTAGVGDTILVHAKEAIAVVSA
jgi:hydrogenase expression/formation protein HypC